MAAGRPASDQHANKQADPSSFIYKAYKKIKKGNSMPKKRK